MHIPLQVTNGLLENAMNTSGRDTFLIDGFPRNDENRAAFEVCNCLAALWCLSWPFDDQDLCSSWQLCLC